MSPLRRVTTVLAAAALGWTTLTLVVAVPSASADAPHDPATYYAGTEGLSGAALATALNAIIDGNTQLTYAQVYDALPFTDEDPNNPANLIDFYSGTSLAKSARCGSGSCAGQWNREHTWPQSHGDLTTGVGPGTDLFHMRPEFADTNSSRGNKDFDNGGTAGVPSCAVCRSTANTFEPRAAIKGDLARGLMYMDVRFNGDATDGTYGQDLVLGENIPTSGPHIGRLSTLVAWSLADPPDAAERARNNLIDATYQHNRNPFIDHPEWVCSIWGSSVPAGTCNVPVNQPPATAPMTKTTAEDTATTVALTASDPDGDPLSWSVTTAAAHGSTSITGGATLSYTPTADYHGSDVVGVTVSDGKGGTAATTVTFTVTPVNDPPTATPQSVSTPEDAATVATLAGTDVDGDTLGFAIAGQPAHGSVSLAGDQATYTPAAGYHGPDSFSFTASDGTATSSAATVSVTVTSAGNHAPAATPQGASTPEDTVRVVTLAGTDVDGDTLGFAIAGQPAHGSVSLAGDQATYTPAADYHGPDSFTFTANDGAATSSTAAVSITVSSVNDAPVATPQAVSTPEDTVKVVTLAGTDVDGDTVGFAIAGQPAHGSVSLAGDQATYTPAADYTGPDSFTFTVDDGMVTSSAATVSIAVSGVNDLPAATPQGASTAEDTAKDVTLTGTDPDGDALDFAIAGQPAHGSVSLAGDEATYTPAANYHGPDSFTFTVDDGTVTSPPATVSITVSSVNDAPAANPQSVTTPEDAAKVVTLAGTDVDGDGLTYAIGTGPGHGTVNVVGDHATYTPAANYHGPDSFTFTVDDGTVTSAPATVSVTVGSVNDVPVATAQVVTTAEDAAKVVTLAGSDVDGDALTYTSATGPAHGTVSVVGDQATYTPAANYHGPDSFTFTVDDGTVTSAPSTVSITVSPVNDAPTLADVTLSTTAGNLVSTTLAPVDVDGDTLTVDSVTVPSHGTVQHSGLTVTYTPAARSATDAFSVTVSDGHGGTATAEIRVSTAARTATLSLSTQPATRGKPVTTIITASGPAGAAPSGPVTLRSGAVTVGTARLGADGTAQVTWLPTVAGVVGLDAAYDGDGLFAPATAVGVAAVERSASELTLSGKLRKSGRGKLKVSVTSIGGMAATGTVTVKVGSTRLTATLRDGVATFRIRELPSKAKVRVAATYAGDAEYAGGTAKHTFRLR